MNPCRQNERREIRLRSLFGRAGVETGFCLLITLISPESHLNDMRHKEPASREAAPGTLLPTGRAVQPFMFLKGWLWYQIPQSLWKAVRIVRDQGQERLVLVGEYLLPFGSQHEP